MNWYSFRCDAKDFWQTAKNLFLTGFFVGWGFWCAGLVLFGLLQKIHNR